MLDDDGVEDRIALVGRQARAIDERGEDAGDRLVRGERGVIRTGRGVDGGVARDVAGDGFDVPLGEDAIGLLFHDRLVAGGLFVPVVFLDQQPVRLGLARGLSPHAHQHPFAPQFLSVKDELEIAFG